LFNPARETLEADVQPQRAGGNAPDLFLIPSIYQWLVG
jgi:hypothetical protein